MSITLPFPYQNAPTRTADVTQTMLDLYNVVAQINSAMDIGAGGSTINGPVVIPMASGSTNAGLTNPVLYLNVLTPASTANYVRFAGAIATDLFFGRNINADSFGFGAVNGATWTTISVNGIVTSGNVTVGGAGTLLATTNALTSGAGAQTATLTNSPTSGNPTKWVAINDAGTTRYLPLW